jgi:hypothetical protein
MLAALALIADSPAPGPYKLACLVGDESSVFAYAQGQGADYFGPPKPYWAEVYGSGDGGETWTQTWLTTQGEEHQELNCSPVSWPVTVRGADGSESSIYYVAGQGMYSSDDNGQTLHLEQQLAQVLSAMVDPSTGNLIIAAGTDGVFVRNEQAEWIHSIPAQE